MVKPAFVTASPSFRNEQPVRKRDFFAAAPAALDDGSFRHGRHRTGMQRRHGLDPVAAPCCEMKK